MNNTSNLARVIRLLGLVTVQDLGRTLRHLGVPSGGPLDLPQHLSTLDALGLSHDTATLEIAGDLQLLVAEPTWWSLDGSFPQLAAGVLRISAHNKRRIRYLALGGGLDVPIVLGSRSTCLPGQFGGMTGRGLQRGDRVPIFAHRWDPTKWHSSQPIHIPGLLAAGREEPLDLLAIPDAISWPSLEQRTFQISSQSNRVGTRLIASESSELPQFEVSRLRRDASSTSRPIVPGTVQLPPDGHPIVVGPDGPVTGGYDLLGVLSRTSQARLARQPIGAIVRLRPQFA